jgi:hypothetical protein
VLYQKIYKTFFRIDIQLYQQVWDLGKRELCGNSTPKRRSIFTQFRVFPISMSVDVSVYQYGKNVLYFFIIYQHENVLYLLNMRSGKYF